MGQGLSQPMSGSRAWENGFGERLGIFLNALPSRHAQTAYGGAGARTFTGREETQDTSRTPVSTQTRKMRRTCGEDQHTRPSAALVQSNKKAQIDVG